VFRFEDYSRKISQLCYNDLSYSLFGREREWERERETKKTNKHANGNYYRQKN